MKIATAALLIAVSGLAQAAPPTVEQQALIDHAIKVVKDELKDADSAHFRRFRTYATPGDDGSMLVRVCGEVNSKNSYGGYTGFAPFVVSGERMNIAGSSDVSSMIVSVVCDPAKNASVPAEPLDDPS